MKKLLIIFILFFMPIYVNSEDITKSSKITINGNNISSLVDGDEKTYTTINKGDSIKITNDEEIYEVQITYEMTGVSGRISNYTREIEIGTEESKNQYINIEELIGASKELEIFYYDTVKISEIHIFKNSNKIDIPNNINNNDTFSINDYTLNIYIGLTIITFIGCTIYAIKKENVK